MNRDEYIDGGHDFWVHFWFGLIVGALIGAFTIFGVFDHVWENVAGLIAMALTFAFCCGKWGDRAWKVVGQLFEWWL